MRKKYQVVLGIDPGRKGAICRLDLITSCVSFAFLPTKKAVYPVQLTKTGKVKKTKRKKSEPVTIYDLTKMLELVTTMSAGVDVVAIEEQHGRPTDGSHAVLEVGKSQAYLEMACVSAGVPYVIVCPRRWKTAYLRPGADKSESIVAAKAVAAAGSYVVEFPLVKDEAKAEAMLIADYVVKNSETFWSLERSG